MNWNSKAWLTLLVFFAYCGFNIWWWNDKCKRCCTTSVTNVAIASTTTDLPLSFNWEKNEVLIGTGFEAYKDQQIKNLGPSDTLQIKTWYYEGEVNGEQVAMQRAEAIKALYPNVAPRFKVINERRTGEDKFKSEKFAAAEFVILANQKSLVKKDGNKITIYFATNSGSKNVEKEIDDYLNSLVAEMKINPNETVIASGHTDNVGDDTKNMVLSKSRAEFVKTLLTGKGADATKISTEGKGETTPIATNDTEDGRKLNRRVELIINNP
jgi:outer membrane protein OmpA-like peptidoglycan-associated protein